jgi:chemotaxis protein CheZ
MDDAQGISRLDLFADMKSSAELLVKKLEEGDLQGASSLIEAINAERDKSIYKEVGRLTRGLHEAIVNFQIDVEQYGANIVSSESEMANARDRLDYVINLTQDAADKTMDMVEEGMPVASKLGQEAVQLKADWGRLIRREMDPSEFRALYQRVDQFLGDTSQSADILNEKFNNILMAQGFQDLTGQVIKKVITLVQDVELRLVDLVRVAGQVEEITGIVEAVDKNKTDEGTNADIEAEGPQIKTDGRADVVSGQDDVDELLSSLGF